MRKSWRVLLFTAILFSNGIYSIVPANADLYSFTSHTFTNCSTTGASGPSLASCKTAYSTTWDENNSYFTVTSGIQSWVAPVTATYIVTAAGATGVGGGKVKGVGAVIQARVNLTQGATYKILVGQSGSNSTSGGGGGGTYLTTSTNSPLIIAGGGAGAVNGTVPSTSSANGQTTTSGGNASDGTGSGGTSGNGGNGSSSGWGGGGGGLTGNGTAAYYAASYSYSGLGTSFTNGGTGGNSATTAVGGFGGGGGTHGSTGGGGGGGGYSGGGGSTQGATSVGGGGGSYVVSGATNIATSNGSYAGSSSGITNLGIYNGTFDSVTFTHGYLTIEVVATPDTTAPTFTSSSTFSAAENIATSTTAATIKVSESATVTISSGADASLFNISASDSVTALIKFKSSPNYESPTDVGGNNVYEITLTATDTAANAGTRSITITVTDVVDTSSFNSFALAGSATSATFRATIQINASVSVASKVTFKAANIVIPGCKSKLATGSGSTFTVSCSWKPSKRGAVAVSATSVPTNVSISGATAAPINVSVVNRSGPR